MVDRWPRTSRRMSLGICQPGTSFIVLLPRIAHKCNLTKNRNFGIVVITVIVIVMMIVICSSDISNESRDSSSNHRAMGMCLDCEKRAQLVE